MVVTENPPGQSQCALIDQWFFIEHAENGFQAMVRGLFCAFDRHHQANDGLMTKLYLDAHTRPDRVLLMIGQVRIELPNLDRNGYEYGAGGVHG